MRRARMTALCALMASAAVAGAVAAAPTLRQVDDQSGPDGFSDYSAFAAGRLLVGRGDGVLAFDPATGRSLPRFVPGERTHAVIPVPGRDLAVSTNGATNTVTVFRPSTGEVVKELASGGLKPDAAAFDPASGEVAVMHGRSGDVTFVDLSKPWIARSVHVGGELEGAAADGRGLLAVAVADRSELALVDVRKGIVLRRLKLRDCEDPSAVAFDAVRRAALVACKGGVELAVALDTGVTLAVLHGGKEVDAILRDEAHDAWLAIAETGSVTVIGRVRRGYRVLADIPVTPGARSGAIDPTTGRLYLPSVRYAKVGKGYEAVPGSFRIRTYEIEGLAKAPPR